MSAWRPPGFPPLLRSGTGITDPTPPNPATRPYCPVYAADAANAFREVLGDRRQREEQARQPRKASTFL